MRKLLIFLIVTLTCVSFSAYAQNVRILATDKAMFVFSDGSYKLDSNRYESLYEIDKDTKTIRVLYDKDLLTNKKYKSDKVFQLVDKPTADFSPQDVIKGVYINPKTSGVETIVFFDNLFHYSKTQHNYINLASGSYSIITE